MQHRSYARASRSGTAAVHDRPVMSTARGRLERVPMFVTSHVLAGAIVGTTCRRSPAAAFALGVASHVAMDLTPHWGDPDQTEEQFLVVAKRDGLLGLGALAAALVAGVPPRRALAAAMLGAVLLDLDKPGRHFFGRSPMPAVVDRFHKAIQREAPDRLGLELAYGAALAAGAAAVLVRGRRAR